MRTSWPSWPSPLIAPVAACSVPLAFALALGHALGVALALAPAPALALVLALALAHVAPLPALAQPAPPHAATYHYKGSDRAARLLERARAEGSVTLYTSLAPTESGPLADAFEKKTGVKVNLWRAVSDSVLQRAMTEARAKRYIMDVVETNGPEVEALAREQVLSTFFSPHLADLPPGGVPKHGMWAADRLSFFVVAYNTNKVRAADLPKTYEGFLDPKWKGRITLEATDSEWMAGVVKTWGEARGLEFFRRLGALKPDLRKGHVLLAQLIASGEVEVGLTAYHANVQSFKSRGAPQVFTTPAIHSLSVASSVMRPFHFGSRKPS